MAKVVKSIKFEFVIDGEVYDDGTIRTYLSYANNSMPSEILLSMMRRFLSKAEELYAEKF